MTTATAPAPPAKPSLFSRAFGFLQKIGKSLMLPVSVLPVAGILLGVGGAFIGGFQQARQGPRGLRRRRGASPAVTSRRPSVTRSPRASSPSRSMCSCRSSRAPEHRSSLRCR